MTSVNLVKAYFGDIEFNLLYEVEFVETCIHKIRMNDEYIVTLCYNDDML